MSPQIPDMFVIFIFYYLSQRGGTEIISSYTIFYIETLDLKDGSCGKGILRQSHLWFAHAESSFLKAQLLKYGLSLGEGSDCSSFQNYIIAYYLIIL